MILVPSEDSIAKERNGRASARPLCFSHPVSSVCPAPTNDGGICQSGRDLRTPALGKRPVIYILPPWCLHFDLNFLRALPCKPLALAWSEQALEIACLSAALAAV